MTYKRKLVAIMFTDIVGYTKLMQESEKLAITLRNRHRKVIDETHSKYRGKVIQYLGDGTLSIFESTADAVYAAIEIQHQLQKKPQVPLRIGLHLGDVVVTETDIIGNGVNLASRLESLSTAGAILISNKVMEEIKNQPIPVKPMGTFHFKNDEFPREVFAIASSGLTIPALDQMEGKLEARSFSMPNDGLSSDLEVTNKQSGDLPDLTSQDDRLEQTVRDIILQNLANTQFSVEILCKKVGYSRPQLYRKLQLITGHSPSELIREIRLQQAATLLRNNTGNVSEIAYQTGFSNLSYFSKAFQERFGSAPSQYAKVTRKTTGIPVALTQFIGRDKEISEILGILRNVRLLTLTGMGGTGKTRLSLELLGRLDETIADETYFVQLAPVGDPEQILPKIAQILKLQQDPTRDTLELILEFVSDKKLLLVLDNFEHVVSAATVVSSLLQHCLSLKILITSRVILNINGESEYIVPPLTIPKRDQTYSLSELQGIHSVRLFVDRVQSINPNFHLNAGNHEAIVDLCASLDGLPLAIELAAARMKMFSPEALLKRLSNNLDILKSNAPDQPERHRTLTNAIDWSYSLLAPHEQTLFRRLSVFSGGCTIDTAESICFQDYVTNFDIIDSLAGLVDQSLLQREDQADGEPRFHMLETIKAFSRNRLDKSLETEDLMDRYVDYFSEKLQDGEHELTGPKMDHLLALIDAELDNLRAILTWLEKKANAEGGMQFALSFWRYWTIRSMMKEGAHWLKRMLEIPSSDHSSILRCRALNAYGVMFGITRRIINAQSIFQESLEIARNLQYEEGIAKASNYLAWIHQFRSDFKLCDQYSLEALAIFTRLEKHRDIAATYNNMGFSARLQGKLPISLEYYQTAKNIMKKIGDQRGYAYNLCSEGWVHAFMGNYDLCEQATAEALEILEALDDTQLIAFALSVLACNFCFMQSYDRVEPLIERALPYWKKSGNFYGEVMCEILQILVLMKTRAYDQAGAMFSHSIDPSMENVDHSFVVWKKQLQVKWLISTDKNNEALIMSKQNLVQILEKEIKLFLPGELEDLALLYTRNHSYKTACLLFAYAQKLRKACKIAVPLIWQQDHDQTCTIIKENLGAEEFIKQCKYGEGLDHHHVIELIDQQ